MRRAGRRRVGESMLLVLTALLVLGGSGVRLPPAPSPSAIAAGSDPLPADPSLRVAIAPAFAPGPAVSEVGPAPVNLTLSVDVGLASRDPAGLAALANASAIAGTSAYHQYLSAADADARFGAPAASLAAAESYFASYGLSSVANPDGLLLSVSGAASKLGAAFDTGFDVYRNATGGTFVSHPTAASLPAVVPWTGALGLSTNDGVVPALDLLRAGTALSGQAGCAGSPFGFTPCEIANAYDYASLDLNGTNGSGRTIAVVDAYSSAETPTQLVTDFERFSTDTGLPSGGLSYVFPVPTAGVGNQSNLSPIWGEEAALDTQWAHAAAPGASIEMVYGPNGGAGLYYAVDWVVAHRSADVLSMSWAEPEVGIPNPSTTPCSSACNATTDGSFGLLGPVLELATVEGITLFGASGDCGAAAGTAGVSAEFPASEPFVTGVGATALTPAANGSYGSESAWSGNESANPGCSNGGGSGGGFSVLPRPWWQTGPGTVPSNGRGVPDVSMVGASGTPLMTIYHGGLSGAAGTSVSTPIWAGIAATADQAAGTDLGWLNPSLYAILRSAEYPVAFHEVTTGSNGYQAHAGWNPVTGIGTPVVGELLRLLSAGPRSASSLSVSVYASPRFGPAPLTVHDVVAMHGGSGAVALEGLLEGDGNATPITGGNGSYTFPSAGVYSVEAYAVDSTGNTSASSPVVVVVGGGTTLSVGLNVSSDVPAVGANVTFTATVHGGTAPYQYNFTFGDGTAVVNQSAGTAIHAYPFGGSFCAEVVVRDSAAHPDGGASLRLNVDVGGAPPTACGDPSTPLTVVANASPGVRDAPADFPSLFRVSGGVSPPGGLADQVGVASGVPYNAACLCSIFRAPGAYTVREWVNDTVASGASAEANVSVAPALNATFAASTLSGVVPLTVGFSSAASGGDLADANTTRWTFGNGLNATGEAAQTVYTAPGEYVAIASLSDRGYGNASEAFVVDARAAGATGVGVTATVSPAVAISSGTTIAWNATVVGPAAAVAGTVIEWGLGNGRDAYGPQANETYEAPVDLLAGNVLAASVSVENLHLAPLLNVPITLPGFFATEANGFVPAVDALEVDEDISPAAGLVPLTIDATAAATGPGGVGFGWTFGDGASAPGPSVAHTYYGAGDFTIVLKAVDPYNDVAQRTDGVLTTYPLALADCRALSQSGTAPYSVTLTPQPTGGNGPPYTYLWTLPGGSSATTANVTVDLGRGGTYSVSVVVTDPAGSTVSCTWTLVVANPPPLSAAGVLGLGAVAGASLGGVFLWATRPPRRR